MLKQTQIKSNTAKELSKTKWWEGKSARTVAEFQLKTTTLCMPFDIFQKILEEAIGRPVQTIEIGLNTEGLLAELEKDNNESSIS